MFIADRGYFVMVWRDGIVWRRDICKNHMYVCDNGFHGHDCGEILQSEIKYEKESKKLYKKLSPQIVKRLSLLIAVFLILSMK